MHSSSLSSRFKKLPLALLPALFSTAFSMPVLADPAMDLVQKMSDAMRNLNYRGTFVYMHNDQLETMQISHYRDAQGEKERLVSLNGEAREVLRDNQNLTCIWPSSRKVVVDTARQNSFSPIFIPEDIERLEKFYRMNLVGKDRIADMNAVIVHIDPKDQYRYGMKFWISENTFLMLKSSLLDERGREIEQVMFTSLEVFEPGKQPRFDIMPRIDEGYTRIQYHRGGNAAAAVDSGWQIDRAPGGFWRESTLKRQLPGSEQVVHQLVYTDGLASLSIFIERHNGETPRGSSSMGAVNAFITILNNHSITAIGEVPAITVRQVAESVTPRQ